MPSYFTEHAAHLISAAKSSSSSITSTGSARSASEAHPTCNTMQSLYSAINSAARSAVVIIAPGVSGLDGSTKSEGFKQRLSTSVHPCGQLIDCANTCSTYMVAPIAPPIITTKTMNSTIRILVLTPAKACIFRPRHNRPHPPLPIMCAYSLSSLLLISTSFMSMPSNLFVCSASVLSMPSNLFECPSSLPMILLSLPS